MELVLTSQKLEPSPKRRLETEFIEPGGLLNSSYKSVARCQKHHANSTSISGIKQRIKSRQYQFTSSIDTLLKLSVFATVLALIF
ncbi:hypothetical protein [Psychroserpens sp. SPM9]|uniref:hypothetical protein n=1 Tax=Psychroserpens sp. SPM9 TaxID=2975598 RepID=UPI0021A3F754|nr:hypothetical protein [Psychroserpens sp. SPM9]MDG5490102.1 hypothetical protein [Psychroserpens sp. SPM9]